MTKIYTQKQLAELAQDDEFKKVEGMTEAELMASGEPATEAEMAKVKAEKAVTAILTEVHKGMDGDDGAETMDGEGEVKSYADDFGVAMTAKALVIKHPGHEDQSVHGGNKGGADTKNELPISGPGKGDPKPADFLTDTHDTLGAAKEALSALASTGKVNGLTGNLEHHIQKLEKYAAANKGVIGNAHNRMAGAPAREGLHANMIPLQTELRNFQNTHPAVKVALEKLNAHMRKVRG